MEASWHLFFEVLHLRHSRNPESSSLSHHPPTCSSSYLLFLSYVCMRHCVSDKSHKGVGQHTRERESVSYRYAICRSQQVTCTQKRWPVFVCASVAASWKLQAKTCKRCGPFEWAKGFYIATTWGRSICVVSQFCCCLMAWLLFFLCFMDFLVLLVLQWFLENVLDTRKIMKDKNQHWRQYKN